MSAIVIKVDIKTLRSLLGSETFQYYYLGNCPISVGSLVCFRSQSSLKAHRTVLSCYRYIISIDNMVALHLDDYAAELTLTPFKHAL
jgi:hypothetical protein